MGPAVKPRWRNISGGSGRNPPNRSEPPSRPARFHTSRGRGPLRVDRDAGNYSVDVRLALNHVPQPEKEVRSLRTPGEPGPDRARDLGHELFDVDGGMEGTEVRN